MRWSGAFGTDYMAFLSNELMTQKLRADFSQQIFGRARLLPSRNDNEWRIAISEWFF